MSSSSRHLPGNPDPTHPPPPLLLSLVARDHSGDIRVWHFTEELLGTPCCVLPGHELATISMDFHPVLPHALASISSDMTVK